MKPTLNEQLARMQKLAGIISENQDYYKDAEKDDAAHIDALEKDMKDDAKKTSEGKMTKSDLKAKIKEMILAELTEDDDVDINNPGDLNNMYDPLAEAEGDMQNLKFNWLIKDEDFYKYDEKGVADGLEVRDGKKVKEIVGYFEDEDGDEDFDVIAYISSDGDIMDDDDVLYDFWYKELNKKLADLARKGMEDSYNKDDEEELEDHNYDAEFLFKYFKNKSDLFMDEMREYDAEELMNSYPGLSQEEAEKLEDMLQNPLDEAKKDEEVEDVTVDDTEVVDAPESDMMAGESAEISGIQSNLQAAYAEAKALGDEKLITQIANTITYFTKAHILDTAPINEAEGNLNQVRNKLLGLFQPYGNFQISDMTMKGQNLGTEFRLYSKSKGADWKGLENFMKNNPDFSIKNISKQTFDNPKSIDFSYKTDQINENMFPMLKRILR
jgi:hypothetical protein